MIDVVKRTPRVYSDESRDYQVLARLYTALFNICKMYADDLKEWVPDIDNKLTTLRSRTVNFVNMHEWDLNDLEAITSCFKYLMRRKGTEVALEACVNILMKARGIETGITVDSVIIDRYNTIHIYVANDNILQGILEDLVRYLIPTGMTYRLHDYDLMVINAASGVITDIYYRQDSLFSYRYGDMKYPFNQAMLVDTDNAQYVVSPTSRNFGAYGAYVTNTFVYTDYEGKMATVYVPSSKFTPFNLYVNGKTLYVVPEKDDGGFDIAPDITYNAVNNMLTIGPSSPRIHDPQGVVFRPDDVNNSEGTLIWNKWD